MPLVGTIRSFDSCREDPILKGDQTTSKALRMLVEDGFVLRTVPDPSMRGGGKGNPYEYEVPILAFHTNMM